VISATENLNKFPKKPGFGRGNTWANGTGYTSLDKALVEPMNLKL
jgi:hypothetical protein